MYLAVAVKIVLSICILGELYSRYKARGLPPGVVGFRWLFWVPRKHAWERINEVNRKYGDIAIGSIFGKHVVMINSVDAARELLEKRGAKYVQRPRSVMGGELCGWGKTMILGSYTPEFRDQRKWVFQEMGTNVYMTSLLEMIEGETHRTLRLILARPEIFKQHLFKNFTSMMSRISYGYATNDTDDDDFVQLARVAIHAFTESTAVGRHLVDLLHILRYIPSWLPGAGFKQKAKRYSEIVKKTLNTPHEYTLSQMAAGTATPSLTSRLMSNPSEITKESEESIKWATSSVFRGGLEASTAATHAFFLAMTLYPDVMKKAQQEIDTVVGRGRLPTFADRPSLPYCENVYSELTRWHSAGALSLRRADTDEEYGGYLIPKNSIVIANIWGMMRDEKVYKDPMRFNPDRFVGEDAEPLPFNLAFGFGRRRCPGNLFAQSTVWLMCVRVLAVFDTSKCVENGVEITPEFKQEGLTLVHQVAFKCSIKSRSAEAEKLIMENF